MIGPVESAREEWGADLPDWVEALALACARTSQNKVAKQIGRSPTLVSQVLRRKYPADLTQIEEVVRGVLMHATVQCPAQGEMPMHVCRLWRDRARHFTGHNALRVKMFRACSKCPRNRKEAEDGHED